MLNIAIAPLQDSLEQTGALVVLEDGTSRIRLERTVHNARSFPRLVNWPRARGPRIEYATYWSLVIHTNAAGYVAETALEHALLLKVRRQAERATISSTTAQLSRNGGATEFAEVDIGRVLDDTLQLLSRSCAETR